MMTFSSPNATWYFTTTSEISEHNLNVSIKEMRQQQHPSHNHDLAVKGTDDQTKRLPNRRYLIVDSKIVLIWNIFFPCNLVYGSTGSGFVKKEQILELINHFASLLKLIAIVVLSDL